jgi:hypothetical protein
MRQLSTQNNLHQKEITKYIREKLDNNLIYQIDLVFDNVRYVMID